jgi:mono/diheme cytochrome c family protein
LGWVTALACVAILILALARRSGAQTHPGYDLLLSKPFSSSVMSIDEYERLWTVWEDDARARAEAASPAERRRLAFERYGFIDRATDDTGLPLGYTDDGRGNLVTNCFSCHGGKVAGRAIPGLANAHQDLMALVNDLVALRAADRGDPRPAELENGPLGFPLNYTRGHSNATMFSLALGSMRDRDINAIFPPRPTGPLTHNDMDAPAWWQFKKKEKIYCDAFAPPSTRTLMQFTMSPFLSGEAIRSWEPDFEIVREYIASIEPPKYPFAIDRKMAARGEKVFNLTCARCHGTYGPDGEYPHKVIPIGEIGTDRTRLGAIPRASRETYNQSWFAYYGERPVDLESKGYLAPPLEGVWATAPYLHNGSVPTLHHLFNPDERPTVWKRDEEGYDKERVGLVFEAFDRVPEGLTLRERRMHYDTTAPSRSAAGHLFPHLELKAEEKRWVLEYLKTL